MKIRHRIGIHLSEQKTRENHKIRGSHITIEWKVTRERIYQGK